MKVIKTIPQLDALIINTYILAVICAIAFIFLAIAIAAIIPYQGGAHDRSHVKRRIWFIILAFISSIGFFCYNNFVVMAKIEVVPFQAKFMNCIGISVGIILGVYFIVSFIIMKIFPRSKFGSIISRNKKK